MLQVPSLQYHRLEVDCLFLYSSSGRFIINFFRLLLLILLDTVPAFLSALCVYHLYQDVHLFRSLNYYLLHLLIYAVYIMLSHFFKTFLLKYRYTILFSECVDITGMHPILIDSKWCCIRYFYTYITTICSCYNKNTHNLKIFFILNQTSKNGLYLILKKQRVPFITFRLKVTPMPINDTKIEG